MTGRAFRKRPSKRVWTRPSGRIAHSGVEVGLWTCPSEPIEVDRSRHGRRLRSLRTAARAVQIDWQERHPIRRGTLLLTFTARGRSAARQAAMRKFWHWYDQRFERPHFCWLEAHRRDGWHYQAIVPDAPTADQGHGVAALQEEWARCLGVELADCNVDLVWLPRYKARRKKGPVDYALSYAKKRGDKSYQQQYEDAPTGLHTVMYSRLHEPDALVSRLSDVCADLHRAAGVRAEGRPARIPFRGVVSAVSGPGCGVPAGVLLVHPLWECALADQTSTLVGTEVEWVDPGWLTRAGGWTTEPAAKARRLRRLRSVS